MKHYPKNIICFGTDWYSPSKVSIRQIVENFHDNGSRVLWINPIPIRFPNTRQKDFWNKVQTKARTHSRLFSKQGDGLYVYSPLYIPFYKGPGFAINRLIVSFQILLLRLILGMRRPLVFGSAFTLWFALPSVRGLSIVFHFADKISSFREVSTIPERRRVLEKMEQKIVQASSLCTCSSKSIYDHVLKIADNDATKVSYLPHAVKTELFFADTENRKIQESLTDLDGISHPCAGYFGSLTQANDKDTFLAAAKALPDWSFVFIGRVSGDYSELESLPNVFMLGPKPHEEIPAYGSYFDVCFMGWRAHEWITNCFPLKTLEYLALAKPIVCSCQIIELEERFPDFIVSTPSPNEFVSALGEELAQDNDIKREARRAAVKEETWTKRVSTILDNLAKRGAKYAF